MERRGPAVCSFSDNKEGKDEMIKASIDLQDLIGTDFLFPTRFRSKGLEEGESS
jgi:hypothetical protein